jgi:hypothetical protein
MRWWVGTEPASLRHWYGIMGGPTPHYF